MQRRPTKYNSIELLGQSGLVVETVIDVGVQRDSPDLRELFCDKHQILFEPVSEYHESIRENYEGLSYTLEGIALSDRGGPMHLRDVRSDADGVVSHVAPTDELGDSARVVQRSTLDDYLDVHPVAKPYLIKIDVDGHETEILQGARRSLLDASCLIVETTLFHLPERLRLAEAAGLALWDIVDLAYYDGSLYQCDLVFIPAHENGLSPRIDPRMRLGVEPFDPAAWYSLHALNEDG